MAKCHIATLPCFVQIGYISIFQFDIFKLLKILVPWNWSEVFPPPRGSTSSCTQCSTTSTEG